MTLDIRTQKEIERDNRHRKIINDFLALCEQNPDASQSRLINKVAELNGMTPMGIRKILDRRNILSPNFKKHSS